MELINLITIIVLVVIIAILVVIYLFARKKDKDDESKSKKNTKEEVNEKLDELLSKKDETTSKKEDTEKDTETEISKVNIDEETNQLGKELVEEGLMDESALEEDLAGIDEMFLEDSDEDIEEIKDEVEGVAQKQNTKKPRTKKDYNTFEVGEGSDNSLFKDLEKLSKYEKKDEYNIMRDLKGKDFDVKNLEDELKSVIKEINKVKRKKSKRRR